MSTSLKPGVTYSDNIQGDANAMITLVEYGDYQCPHCGHAYPIIKQLQQTFGSELKIVFRNFPLKNLHPLAVDAAIASEAAGRQNRFWEMHDLIFENQRNLDETSFLLFAQQLGLDLEQFNVGTVAADVIQKVDDDFESGIMSGVNGTPTFFINGFRYDGSWDLADLTEVISGVINK